MTQLFLIKLTPTKVFTHTVNFKQSATLSKVYNKSTDRYTVTIITNNKTYTFKNISAFNTY